MTFFHLSTLKENLHLIFYTEIGNITNMLTFREI